MLTSCPENSPPATFAMDNTIRSFFSPAPNSPFHVPEKSLSVFAACPVAHEGSTVRIAIPIKNAAQAPTRPEAIPKPISFCPPIFKIALSLLLFIPSLLHVFPFSRIQNAISPRRRFLRIKILLEGSLREPGTHKLPKFRPRQRPRQLSLRFVQLTAPDNGQ